MTYDIESMAERIRSSGRRRRPEGRWSNPASPLQAARFELRKNGKEVVAEIRKVCRGHAGKPCRIDLSKLSDYECRNRRPGLEHIEAFCRFYERSPEELGLITWRDEPATPTNGAGPDSSGSNGSVSGGDSGVDRTLLQLLTETAALTSVTTRLLQATLDHRARNGHGGPDGVIHEPADDQNA